MNSMDLFSEHAARKTAPYVNFVTTNGIEIIKIV